MKSIDRSGGYYLLPADIYTVTEISEAIRQDLESEFPSISVIGEIANFKAHISGHCYFSLRDATSTLSAVLFRRQAGRLAFEPQNGMMAIATGRISFYGGSGRTQIIAESLEQAGRGVLELEFRRLLGKLTEEGLTADSRKRKIPPYPSKIAVITSPTGAVIRDIVDTLARRWPMAELIHIPSEVQGKEAAASIEKAFDAANSMKDLDLVILARGGGSLEDLQPFNTEIAARAVASSIHPVVTGIGHEVDTTICDYVSDLRAATPTAAAELSSPSWTEVDERIRLLARRAGQLCGREAETRLETVGYLLKSGTFKGITHRIDYASLKCDDLADRIAGSAEDVITARAVRTAGLSSRLAPAAYSAVNTAAGRFARSASGLSSRDPGKKLSATTERLRQIRIRMDTALSSGMRDMRSGLRGTIRLLDGVYPKRILERGYAYCMSEDGKRIIGKARDISKGDRMIVNFHDGGALCRVEGKRAGKRAKKS